MIRIEDFNQNTIARMLAGRKRYSSRDVAYIFPELAQRCTWHMVWEQTQLVARGFIELGIKKGDRVAILMEDRLEFVTSFLAAASIGAVAVPINTYSRKDELKVYLRDSKSVLLIIGRAAHKIDYPTMVAELIAENQENYAWLPKHVFVLDEKQNVPKPFHVFSDLMEAKVSDKIYLEACKQTTENDPIVLLYTSGTTGFPKGVARTAASFISAKKPGGYLSRSMKTAFTRLGDKFSTRFAVMSLLPLYHMGGVSLVLTTVSSSNIKAVMLTRFNPVSALDAMEQVKCQFLVGTPFMIQKILAVSGSRSHVLNSVLGLVFTSAPVRNMMVEKIMQQMKKLMYFTVSYGSSEAGPVANGTCFISSGRSWGMSVLFKLFQRMGVLNGMIPYEVILQSPYSVGGRVDKAVEVRIMDKDQDIVLPEGQEGEIVVRGHRVMRYVNDSHSHKTHLKDGWYRMGDMGFLDQNGFLVITGRIKRLISRGGEKISPVEVEMAILKNPEVEDAIVVGVADELYGEQVCALIVAKEGHTVNFEELKQKLSDSLSAFKIPRYFIAVPSFPLTPSGKIAVDKLHGFANAKVKEPEYHA